MVRRRCGSVSTSSVDRLAILLPSGSGVVASTMTAASPSRETSGASMRSRPLLSLVADARFQMRPATLREMGSSAVSESCVCSSTPAARAKPIPPMGCGPAAGLPAHTWCRRSMESKVSWKAMPSASMPWLSWNSLTAASV